MGNIKDLTGQKFGRLTVIKDSGQRKNRQVVWECKCDCGNTTYVVGQALRTGHTQSCGCLRAERTSLSNSKNLLGQRFGKLLVIKRMGTNKNRNVLWECKCDCGNICTKSTGDLLNSHVKSCGCTHSKGELQIKQLLNKYEYNFISQYQNFDLLSPTGNYLKIDFMLLDSFGNPIRAIQCDGQQHYKPIDFFGGIEAFTYLKKCDIIKNEWCKKNNIPIIRIPSFKIKQISIEDILGNKYEI